MVYGLVGGDQRRKERERMAQKYKVKLEFSRLSETYMVLTISGPTVQVSLSGVYRTKIDNSGRELVEVRAGDILTEDIANHLGMFADLTVIPKAELGGYSRR